MRSPEPGRRPKSKTVTIWRVRRRSRYRGQRNGGGGTPISARYTAPAGGGNGKVIESRYEAVSGKRMSASRRETSYSKGGKVVYTTHAQLSKDGKTLTVHSKETNPAGQMVDGTLTYDKQ
jgi:hypothetical protein